MKKLILTPVLILAIMELSVAQNIGIGTNTPNTSAALEIKSGNKGLLIPRTSTASRNSIADPAKGLIMYDTIASSFWFYSGSIWKEIAVGSNGWNLTGNTGIDTAVNFLGTIDEQPLIFKVNNGPSGIIDLSSSNTGFGYLSLAANKGSFNSAFGYNALTYNTTGVNNIAIGYGTLFTNTDGADNVAIGKAALFYNNAAENTAVGFGSLYANTTGHENTAIGSGSLQLNNGGSDNTATGYKALYSNDYGGANTANGYHALYTNVSGDINTADGNEALYSNAQGGGNTADGYQALYKNTSGNSSTAIGREALYTNTTGSYNTGIGYDANVASGDLTNATAIGYAAHCDASNKVRIGNIDVTSIGGQVGWTTFSDGRYKKDIKEDVPGLAFINSLRPVTYTVDLKSLDAYFNKNRKADRVSNEKLNAGMAAAQEAGSKIIHTGFIAQEVEATANKLHYDFGGVDKPANPDAVYGLRYDNFVVPLVKAVQEQEAIIEALQKQVEAAKAEIPIQQLEIEALKKENAQLKTMQEDIEKLKAAMAKK